MSPIEINFLVVINCQKISSLFRHTYILNEFGGSSDHNIANDFFCSDDSVVLNTRIILLFLYMLEMLESSESNGTVLVYTFDPHNSWSGINVVNNDIYKKYKLYMLKYNNIVNDFFYLYVFVALNNRRLLYEDFITIPRHSDVVSAKDYVNNTLSLHVAEDAESLQRTLPFVPATTRQSRFFFLGIVDDTRWSHNEVYELLYNSWGFDDDIRWYSAPLTAELINFGLSIDNNCKPLSLVPLLPSQTMSSNSKPTSNLLIIAIAAIIISIIGISFLYKCKRIKANEWINWIEEAKLKKHIKYYEYKKCFNDIQIIGKGHFGEVFRANYKESEQYLALKSFFNIDIATIKEIVHELQLHREIDFHNNIIRFHGITNSNSDDSLKKYLLVLEYADGGSLRNYLKKNFKLNWNDKCNLAYQLACAVSFLHNENIIHCDLHSNNILIHQNNIKLADFGLSRRIEDATNQKSSLYGVIPYIDPKRLENSSYKFNKKSDIYSVGVLLWEISSGRPPFYAEHNYHNLVVNILQGLRETPISDPDIPSDYIKVYTVCWDGMPDNRLDMRQVTIKLKEILKINENDSEDNPDGLNQLLKDQLSDKSESDLASQRINPDELINVSINEQSMK